MDESQHYAFIRRCIELAQAAVAKGNHPFGALLLHQGEIILEAENTVSTNHDTTAHAELNLLHLAAQKLPREILQESILYSSTEPCMMCSGAMYWAGVSHIVYACSETGLAQYAGTDFLTPCREIFAKGKRTIKVEGPILEEEAIQVHVNFW